MKRLTADNIKDITICYALGVFTQRELADWFGVSQSTVSRAVNRGQKE
jgi:DNA-binding transcriptional regulator LsrR (DeoR family)